MCTMCSAKLSDFMCSALIAVALDMGIADVVTCYSPSPPMRAYKVETVQCRNQPPEGFLKVSSIRPLHLSRIAEH